MSFVMSPLPEKMTMSDLEKKCLELSQALINKGQAFNFSITSGAFSFSLDTRGTTTKVVDRQRKKLSPSRVRRNMRRKEEFLKRKAEPLKENSEPIPEKEVEEIMMAESHGCNICERTFESEAGLKIHKGKTHNKELLRSSTPQQSPLQMSTEKETSREEQCVCCGGVMSPSHQCEIFNCHGCEKIFNTEEELNEHEDNTHQLMCHICFKFSNDNASKVKHFKESHLPPS